MALSCNRLVAVIDESATGIMWLTPKLGPLGSSRREQLAVMKNSGAVIIHSHVSLEPA
ncbi:hypothetical protein MESS2_530003 [Mesorhizobium metallidurans STM 2683]|uniref:Uncharacterized protein n=1 Tax=Mesorhizobium metallidurans STM 2683 TaxID=1297569 RepID=M5ERA9_9HYPH|nr:hypothetical protein MESS2_530003 [Mesorhizobium metallidurans STM 2683]